MFRIHVSKLISYTFSLKYMQSLSKDPCTEMLIVIRSGTLKLFFSSCNVKWSRGYLANIFSPSVDTVFELTLPKNVKLWRTQSRTVSSIWNSITYFSPRHLCRGIDEAFIVLILMGKLHPQQFITTYQIPISVSSSVKMTFVKMIFSSLLSFLFSGLLVYIFRQLISPVFSLTSS